MEHRGATPRIFISYSHDDEAWKDRIVSQLAPDIGMPGLSTRLEGVSDPFQLLLLQDGDDIEPAGCIEMVGQQIVSGCPTQALLFGSSDGLGGRTIAAVVTAAYFHEHQAIIVTHDQIHFTGAAAIIVLDQDETLLFQITAGQRLGGFTGL